MTTLLILAAAILYVGFLVVVVALLTAAKRGDEAMADQLRAARLGVARELGEPPREGRSARQ